MMMAVVGFMPKVKGTSMAVPATGPTPGRTPMMVPMVTPKKQKRRLVGEMTVIKPAIKCSNMLFPLHSQEPGREGRLQPQPENGVKEESAGRAGQQGLQNPALAEEKDRGR